MAVDVILARRSIRRDFKNQTVPPKIVEQIVRCGLSAPSSKNAQPWRLHVVTHKKTLMRLADAIQTAKGADTYVPVDPETGVARTDWDSTVSESAEVLRSAPLAVFVENRGEFSRGRTTLAGVPPEHLSAALVGYTFEIVGIGAAIQNMWLAAEDNGLRGVFMGDVLVAESAIASCLDLRSDLVGVLALGYSDASPWTERFYEDDRIVWHPRQETTQSLPTR